MLDEFRTLGISLQDKAQNSVNGMEALKEQCRHPENKINRTNVLVKCDCGFVLWPRSTYWTNRGKVKFSETELSNPGPIREKFEMEYKEAWNGLKKLQVSCDHPDAEKIYVGDTDEECGICRKDWWEVRKEREKTADVNATTS
ncbi:MAG: hypothetical protein UX07_C0027G0004 [Parcubacteria group bacterium GW2011_GWA2_45_30]|nr:MAG: hypothetical protein UX07_C0027G0004 [Parcubacteria group bacterium GW2011_GWA2_45_30]